MVDTALSRDYKEDVYKFGTRLVEWREAAGLSQPQLAKLLGVTQQAVSEWEGGKSLPRITRVRALADHLCVAPGVVTAALAEEGETNDERTRRLEEAAVDIDERLRRQGR